MGRKRLNTKPPHFLGTVIWWAILTPVACGVYLYLMELLDGHVCDIPRALHGLPVYVAYPALSILDFLDGINIVQLDTNPEGNLLWLGLGCIAWWVFLGAVLGAFYHPIRKRRRARRRLGCCGKCGYDLRGLPEPRCPECGTPFDPQTIEGNRSKLHEQEV